MPRSWKIILYGPISLSVLKSSELHRRFTPWILVDIIKGGHLFNWYLESLGVARLLSSPLN